MSACKYGDPLCPCQDGDMCHYEGPNPMKPPNVTNEMQWICENPECRKVYAEYVNGCISCYEGRIAQGLFPLHFSVRLESRLSANGAAV